MVDTVTMPKLGFDMAEGTLVRWVIAEGEAVSRGAILAEIETDKATVEVESAFSGILRQHLVSQGTVVPVGNPIAIIAGADEKVELAKLTASVPVPVTQTAGSSLTTPKEEASTSAVESFKGMPQGVKASPLARRMAEERGIDLKLIAGTGPGDRIVKKDIDAYIVPPPIPKPAAIPTLPGEEEITMPVPTVVLPGQVDQVIPLNRLRTTIGRRMLQSKQQSPHFYITYEYDMERLMALRTQINALFPESEKISVNDFIIKAVGLALQKFPNLNASFDNDKVIQHRQVNVGVAVAVEGGLLTVVCRNVATKPLRQIALEVRSMVERARQGKVRPEDVEGSTITLSNLGMYGVENFAAIINPPEAAILAVGKVRETPVVINGEIRPGLRMKATISVDHRVSDGAEAAQFMQSLAPILEEPLRLLVK